MANWKDWLEEAREDLRLARELGRAEGYARACFLCQQAVEKALKALVLKRKNVLVKSHSLHRLSSIAGVLKELGQLIGDLEADYTSSRYVDLSGKLTREMYDKAKFEERAKSAKTAVELIEKWIMT